MARREETGRRKSRTRRATHHLLLGIGLLAACSVDAVDYRGKSCANGPCPDGLICVSPGLVCESPSGFTSAGRGGSAGGGGNAGLETEASGSARGGSAGSGNAAGSLAGGGNGPRGRSGGGAGGDGAAASFGSAIGGAGEGGGGEPGEAGHRQAGGRGGSSGAGNGNAGNASGTGGNPTDDFWGGGGERTFSVTRPWNVHYIKICYRPLFDLADEDVALDFWQHTRSLIESSWGRLIDISLQEWKRCVGFPWPVIEVSLSSTGPSSSELGDPGAGTARELALDIHATDVEVLYTFGRALGFEHEFGRHAYTGPCARCAEGGECTQGDRTTCLPSGYCGDPADHESIMAAPDCGGLESIRKLSAWDALGAQRAYGSKPPATFVDVTGHCLVVGGGTGIPGENMILYPCDEPSGEAFFREADTGVLQQLVAPFSSNVCLTFSGPLSSSSATQLFTAACDSTVVEQSFEFQSMRLRAMGNMCVAARSASAGAELAIYDCDAPEVTSELARWSLLAQSLELEGSELCIAIPDAATPGAHLILEPCDPAAATQRVSLANGLILFDVQTGGLGGVAGCAKVADPSPTGGGPLVFSDSCDLTRKTEVFYATGPVENAGQCMASVDLRPEDETRVGLAPCDGSARQEWDYHF